MKSLEPAGGVDGYRLERRRSPRRPQRTRATAAFEDEGGAIIAGVTVLDASSCGLGLECPVPVPAGARVSVLDQDAPVDTPPGALPGARPGEPRADVGIVAHCRPEGDAFRVGVRLSVARADRA